MNDDDISARLTALIADQEQLLEIIREKKAELLRISAKGSEVIRQDLLIAIFSDGFEIGRSHNGMPKC